nr:MAG TPA: hypothetical protein [Caudoviricetes sp.]
MEQLVLIPSMVGKPKQELVIFFYLLFIINIISVFSKHYK